MAETRDPDTPEGADAESSGDGRVRPDDASGEGATRLPDVEAVLFLSDPHGDEFFEDDEPSIVLDSAAFVLHRLDPLAQEGAVEDSGRIYLPGLVPLAPVTLTAFFLNFVGLITSMCFGLLYVPAYTIAFAVFHVVIFGNLRLYYVGYRLQKSWMRFRQLILMGGLVTFVDWMGLDLIEHPPAIALAKARVGDGYESLLVATMMLTTLAVGTVAIHWLVLGRGLREVTEEDMRAPWWRRRGRRVSRSVVEAALQKAKKRKKKTSTTG